MLRNRFVIVKDDYYLFTHRKKKKQKKEKKKKDADPSDDSSSEGEAMMVSRGPIQGEKSAAARDKRSISSKRSTSRDRSISPVNLRLLKLAGAPIPSANK